MTSPGHAPGIAVEVREPKGIGRCRMAVLADASAAALGPFVSENVEPGTRVITDGWGGYNGPGRPGLRARAAQPAGRRPPRRGPRRAAARRHRGPPGAAAALDPAVGQLPPASMTAMRAREPARPAQPLQVVKAVLVSAEPRQELTSRPRIVRTRSRIVHELSVLRLTAYPRAPIFAAGSHPLAGWAACRARVIAHGCVQAFCAVTQLPPAA